MVFPTPPFLPQNFLCHVFFVFIILLIWIQFLLYKTFQFILGFYFLCVKCQCNIKCFAFIRSSKSEVRVCLLFFCLQGFPC